MADDDTQQQDSTDEQAPTPPEGQEEPQDGQEPADGAAETPATWDQLLATLAPEQRDLAKGELRKVRNEARNLRERASRAEAKAAEHDDALEATKTAEQRQSELSDTLRADNEGLRKRIVAQEISLLAASRFADPSDPVGFLDPTEFLTTDLEPDRTAIGDALDELLLRKPHLARVDNRPRPPAPTRAQGGSGNGTPSVDSQAADARKRGDHRTAIALEMQKLGVSTVK